MAQMVWDYPQDSLGQMASGWDGGAEAQKREPWPDPFMPSCPGPRQPLGALSNPVWHPHTSLQAGDLPPTTPKLHPQILHSTLQVEKRERSWGDPILSLNKDDFSDKLLISCFLSSLKVTGLNTPKTNHLNGYLKYLLQHQVMPKYSN